MAQPFLQGCTLPAAWANQPAWRILETELGDGRNFLATWGAWQSDRQRPRTLHYVAVAALAPDPKTFETLAESWVQDDPRFAALAPLARLLAGQCFGLLPGFHRLEFEEGQVLLTLCIGELKTMLREQRFAADSVFLIGAGLNPDSPAWDHWTAKALARCCRRSTLVACGQAAPALLQALSQCGFEMRRADPAGSASKVICSGIYDPRWEPKNSRDPSTCEAQLPAHCVVVGAGLAGASVAQALARRGWQVQVLDAASAPAAGASGLPVGLMVPHVSADDSPRSRLSRAGIRLMLNQARALLVQGQDWGATGVLERRLSGAGGLPLRWPAQAAAWSQPANDLLADTLWGSGLPGPCAALWHACAAWIKPARLVQAWLAQPGVQFKGGACVAQIRREGEAWVLFDAASIELARANIVVLAAAGSTTQLLDELLNHLQAHAIANASTAAANPPSGWASELASALPQVPRLQAVSGQISWARQRPADGSVLPPYPVNGLGSLVAHVPVDDLLAGGGGDALPRGNASGLAWFAGATYETQSCEDPPSIAAQHHANHARLQALLPACAQALADQFNDGSAQAWRNTRYAPADRLPVVGPLMDGDSPTLWISTGLGSRGLSTSVLCAELLAARLGAEPWPVEASLARHLEPRRKKHL